MWLRLNWLRLNWLRLNWLRLNWLRLNWLRLIWLRLIWLRLALALVAIVALGHEAHAASSWFWCEPLHAYYPWVRSCPVAWRQVDPRSPPSQQPQYEQSQAPQETGTAPVPSSEAAQPTFPSSATVPRGDGLDQWCQGSITALNMVICTDNDLRAEAVQRLHAFDDAKARLTPDQQKTLAADQNGWAMSYAQSCGLQPDTPPALPLAPSVKECLAQAGQQRLAYLRSYGTATASNPATPTANAGSPASIPEPVAPAAGTPAASTAPQPAPSPAPANEASSASAPAVSLPSSSDTKASSAGAAPVSSCSGVFTRASANPFGNGERIPALGTLQGGTMAASLLLASATICLWIFAFFRKARSQPR
jgi:hypothetical protein